MKIDFIGTGNVGTLVRSSSSTLFNDEILFDIGTGTLGQLKINKKDTSKIKYIIITHYHADHILDIVDFIFRRSILKEDKYILKIIGPENIKQKVIDLFYFTHGDNIPNKFDNIEKDYKLEFIEMFNCEKEIDYFKLKSVKVKHGTCTSCNGYILNIDNFIIGYTGDTTICEGLDTVIKESNHIFIDSTMVETNKAHIGYKEIVNIAQCNKDKVFYAIHRGDYEIEKTIENIKTPNDGDVLILD